MAVRCGWYSDLGAPDPGGQVPPPAPQPVADPVYHGLVWFHAFAAAANSPNRSYTPPLPQPVASDIALPDSSEEMLRSTRFIDDT